MSTDNTNATDERLLSFEPLRQAILDSPTTWLPALLEAAVRAANTKPVFVPGGLLVFVQDVLEKMEREKQQALATNNLVAPETSS